MYIYIFVPNILSVHAPRVYLRPIIMLYYYVDYKRAIIVVESLGMLLKGHARKYVFFPFVWKRIIWCVQFWVEKWRFLLESLLATSYFES